MTAFRLWACLFTLAAGPALAGDMDPAMRDMPGMHSAPKPAPAGTNTMDADMMSGMAKMNSGMNAAPMTGNADKDFTAMMIPHHQGAIDMAEAELKYGKDPFLRRLAQDIVAAQKKEIGAMKDWQRGHGGP